MAHEDFCEDYVLLKPDEGGLKDLFKFLVSNDISESKFIDCPEGKQETEFKRRRIIFASIVVQKLLTSIKIPLAWYGSTQEMWLNLLSQNQGLSGILINILKGKLMIPDKTSTKFASTLGYLDRRIELDHTIKHNDSKYNAQLSIMAAKISYENEAFVKSVITDNWKMEFLGFYNFWNEYQEMASTQAIMFTDKTSDSDLIVVAFRGTETYDSDAWNTDFDLSWYEIPDIGKVHGGFMKALGLQKVIGWPKEVEQEKTSPQGVAYYSIRERLREIFKENSKARFIVTGHSLGAALAALFPVILAYHKEGEMLDRLEGVYTFGQPRVGDEKLGEFITEKLRVHNVKFLRFVYGNDIVPRLPYDDTTLMFKHFGTCIYYDRFYQAKIMKEEPNKNYFSIQWWLPKIGNAMMELGRSFTIERKHGPNYREGWFLRNCRVIGLFIPGIPAHTPQDYVNSIRLGPSLMELSRQDSSTSHDQGQSSLLKFD